MGGNFTPDDTLPPHLERNDTSRPALFSGELLFTKL